MALPMPEAAPAERVLTYEDYQQLPETMQRYEIVDGVMTMSPSPTEDHQWLLSELYDRVKDFIRQQSIGFCRFAPLDVVVERAPGLRTRQPDLLYYSHERLGGQGRGAMQQALQNGVGPDLCVEILSPEEGRRRLAAKLGDYVTIGVREVWLVSPEAQTIEVLALVENAYARAGLYGAGDTMASGILTGFTLPIDTLFAE